MNPKKGFSLVELLVVIAVIAALLTIGVPIMHKARMAAKKTACKANLHTCALGFRMYLDDNRDTMPIASMMPSEKLNDDPRIADVLKPYILNPDALKCPADPEGKYFKSEGSSYQYNIALNGQKVEKTFLAKEYGIKQVQVLNDYDKFHNEKGGPGSVMYLYADGRIDDR